LISVDELTTTFTFCVTPTIAVNRIVHRDAWKIVVNIYNFRIRNGIRWMLPIDG
jgi:hypothetical protein